jgi:hypothetical protein
MKEHAKLYKPQSDRKTHTLSKRLSTGSMMSSSSQPNLGAVDKRLNLGDGKSLQVPPPKQQDVNMKAPGK